MRTKLCEFRQAVLTSSYDIIAIAESWLNKDISSAELGLDDFDVFRLDRDMLSDIKKRGGGVLIASRKALRAQKIKILEVNVEQIFIRIKVSNKLFILGCVYFPPMSSQELYAEHCNVVESIIDDHPGCCLVIVGDYNLPECVWGNDEFGLSVQCPVSSPATTLTNCYSYFNLFQLNSVLNSRNVCLDLLFGNVDDIVPVEANELILPNSIHHTAISFVIELGKTIKTISFQEYYYDFRNADYFQINNYFASINWEELFSAALGDTISAFYDVLYTAIEHFVPLRRLSTSSFPKWFSSELKSLVIQKKIAHSRFKKYGSVTDYHEFAHLREQCKELRQRCYDSYINRVEGNIADNPGRFWSYVRDVKNEHDLPLNVTYNDVTSSSLSETVNLFASYFSTVYMGDGSVETPNYNFRELVCINYLNFSVSEVFDAISHLPPKLVSGPDGVPAYFLKNCQCTLALALHKLFNVSLSSGEFPDFWKLSYLKPIYKSGDRSLVSNYRAVSTQSDIPKMLDFLVCQRLTWDFKEVINDEQHGFIRGRSTDTNLVLYKNFILNSMESGLQVDSVYMDFSKAFDRVNHSLLIAKLKALGVAGSALSWIHSYVSNRVLYVRAGGVVSDPIVVPSGVPQGSHCGPVLFCLFLVDLGQHILNSKTLLFADDLKIFKAVKSLSDAESMQDDLDLVAEWCLANKMDLNVNKCFKISFTRSPNPVEFNYSLRGILLNPCNEIKDLGIIFDNKMSFNAHINNITTRALKILGFIQRISIDFSIMTFKRLYCAFVRSVLEYGSVVWNPNYAVYQDAIERVQKKFLRVIAFKNGYQKDEYTYNDILLKLNMQTLQTRRMVSDICFLHKIINFKINCSELLQLINFNTNSRRVRNNNTFNVPFHPTNYGKNDPITRMVNYGNLIKDRIDLFALSYNGLKFKLCNCDILSDL